MRFTTKAFWVDTAERVTRTTAQALIATLGLDGAGVLDADWRSALAVAGGAALMSLLTALAGSTATGDKG